MATPQTKRLIQAVEQKRPVILHHGITYFISRFISLQTTILMGFVFVSLSMILLQSLESPVAFPATVLFMLLVIADLFGLYFIIHNWRSSYYEILDNTVTYYRDTIIYDRTISNKITNPGTITMFQGIIDRMYNCGTIRIQDLDTQEFVTLYSVKNPKELVLLLEKLLLKKPIKQPGQSIVF